MSWKWLWRVCWIPLKWFDNFRQTTLRHTFRLGRRHPRSKSDWFFLHIGGVHVETGYPFLSIQYHPIVSTSIHSWPMSLPGLGTNLAQRSRSSWASALVVGTQSKDVQGKAPQKPHHQNQMITWCGVKVGEESGTKGAPRKAPTRRCGEVKHQHVQFLNM